MKNNSNNKPKSDVEPEKEEKKSDSHYSFFQIVLSLTLLPYGASYEAPSAI